MKGQIYSLFSYKIELLVVEKFAKMAGQYYFGVSEVHTWLSSILHGLNLEMLAQERRLSPINI